ncbi:MAG: 30S ribosomal protein S5 [Candidatus Vogelbacteria bacterium]|nr:30S ribosomal protein S5 [Candidatus Vogelbacteria bacterium]
MTEIFGRTKTAKTKTAPSEFDHKMISLRRVTRVVKGGRRFSFSALVAAGDKRGRIGLGLGKAGDISEAIEKGFRQAKKRMLTLPLTADHSIPHEVMAKFGSSRVVIRPAPERGIVAGSAVRVLLALAGVRGVSAKVISPSKNKINIARAALAALGSLTSHFPTLTCNYIS